jgi:hypothetical protein
MVKQVHKFTYVDSEVNSGGKIDGKTNRRIQNNFKCYEIIKGIYGTEISQTNAKQQTTKYVLN